MFVLYMILIKKKMQYDRSENAGLFCFLALSSIFGGLFLGSLVDTIVRKIQNDSDPWNDRQKSKAFRYFLLQGVINVGLFLACTRLIPNFVSWLQLSVDGALFAVVLFASQRNWIENVNSITNW
jgi:hypothetical protein